MDQFQTLQVFEGETINNISYQLHWK